MKSSAREITFRGVILAIILTIIFAVSNVYLGLRIGGTFSSSIPAAIIAMAILRWFSDNSILENNIVQTFVSAAGSQAAIVFILPAMIMLGIWNTFPYWQLVLLCALSGILGVLFTIPLRRVLVVDVKLPFPEGTAAAEVLKAGHRIGQKRAKDTESLRYILSGTVIAFLWSLLTDGLRLLSTAWSAYFKVGSVTSGFGLSYSMTLLGAGYLIGFEVGSSLLIGLLITWAVAVPVLSVVHHHASMGRSSADFAMYLWSNYVNYIGAGVIAVSALAALIKLLRPLCRAMQSTCKGINIKMARVSRVDQDISIRYLIWAILILFIPLTMLFSQYMMPFLAGSVTMMISSLVLVVMLVLILGFFVSATAGYMAGIVGTFSSPLSGVGIVALVIIALILDWLATHYLSPLSAADIQQIMGVVILTTASIFAMACISNDNMQDLKTGYLVKATPWKQQLSLIGGVLVGAFIIPFVLKEMYQAYGFVGHLPHNSMNSQLALPIPQANLMASLVKGVITHHLKWQMMLLGTAIAMVMLLLNALVLNKKNGWHISVMSVGIGMYLPFTITGTLVVGAMLQGIVTRGKVKRKSLRSTLFSSGLIVGNSLMGVLLAILIVSTNDQTPISLQHYYSFATFQGLGLAVFIAIVVLFGLLLHRLERS